MSPRSGRSGSRANAGEAQAVAEAVMQHAAATPHLTLGVAAFSSTQAQTILDQLVRLRRADPSAEGFFAEHPTEPFFVKNLETVQGDERDVADETDDFAAFLHPCLAAGGQVADVPTDRGYPSGPVKPDPRRSGSIPAATSRRRFKMPVALL